MTNKPNKITIYSSKIEIDKETGYIRAYGAPFDILKKSIKDEISEENINVIH